MKAVIKRTTYLCALLALLTLGALPPTTGQEVRSKKIAVASEGKSLDSQVGHTAARCRYFLLFDDKGQLTEVLENPHRDAAGSAGPSSAELLAENEVTVLVSGNVGHKMAEALTRLKITHLELTGTVEQAVEHAQASREPN